MENNLIFVHNVLIKCFLLVIIHRQNSFSYNQKIKKYNESVLIRWLSSESMILQALSTFITRRYTLEFKSEKYRPYRHYRQSYYAFK